MGLIAAASVAPLAVEAAATTLRDVLIGCTAPAAKTTLRDVTITLRALNAVEKGRGSGAAPSPTGVIAEAINAWKDRSGCMKVHLVRCDESSTLPFPMIKLRSCRVWREQLSLRA